MPTMSRILPVSSGSGEILKSSVRHGCSPNARQMRCTLAGEIPARLASSRLDQCVAPSGTSSRVRTTTSSAWASVMVRGTRGGAHRPARPAGAPVVYLHLHGMSPADIAAILARREDGPA